MSEKILQGIQEAERKAGEIIHLAESESGAAIKEIHERYRRELNNVESRIKQERVEALRKAEEDSMARRDRETHQSRIEKIKNAAEGNREKAVTELIKIFLE